MTTKGLDVYEAEYYGRVFKNSEIIQRDTVKAPDAEAMKKELAFTVIAPVNDVNEGMCLWIPFGRARKVGDHLEHKVVLVKAPQDFLPAVDHPVHLVHSITHSVDGV